MALGRGRPDEARAALERALALLSELFPASSPETLPARRGLFDAALAAGDVGEAAAQAERYGAIAGAWLAADDPRRVDEAQVRALLSAAQGDRPRAVALAREALAIQQTRPWQVLRLAEARLTFARTLPPGDAEGARLRAEARRALRAAKALGLANDAAPSRRPRPALRAAGEAPAPP